MTDIATLTELLDEIEESGDLDELMNNPAAQFGTTEEPYEGARLLAEQNQDENMYKETQIKYRSFVANAGSYYSPAQLNSSGELIGTFNVELGKTDQADQVTAQDYSNLMKLLNRKASREAIMAAMRWMDYHILRPHLDLNEKYRWDAIIDAEVIRMGSNGYSETVEYPDPAGHRSTVPSGTVANPTGWYETDTSYDPFEDIFAVVDLLDKKGYKVNRILTGGRKIPSVLGKNPVVRERTSRITISTAGQIEAQPGRATQAQINAYLNEEGIPPIEMYRKTYHTRANGEKLFVPDNKLVFICSTGRTQPVDLGDRGVLELQNTLGYFGIGTPAGKFQPGRVTNVEERNLYPGGFYAEAIQMGLPVILHPEAIAVLEIPEPTP
ncbi:MAG TPA: major capsid protein [Trichocoleus sp.]|jgi:hypothetical protein